jgi:hypothetical protein
MKYPVTKEDKKIAKKHNKATIKLEKSKIKDHLKLAKKSSGASKAYNLSHAKEHKKDLKARQKYAKKIG